MSDGRTTAADAAQEHVKKNVKDPATLKAKREANFTAGLGYGLKKKRLLDAFWSIVWPGLEKLGWRQVSGDDSTDGAILFLPPNVEMKPGNKRDVDFYDRIKSIVERVEERRNKDEAKLADLFREETRDDDSITLLANPKRGRGRPSLGAPRPGQKVVDISWKQGGSLYPKRSSQVGEDYQVSIIPMAGAYEDEQELQEKKYEIIWDNKKAAEKGVFDFLRDEVPYNKKEKALEAIHTNGYDIATMPDIIRQIRPTDGADWSREQTERFHSEIFRNRKNFKELCKSMEKEMQSIICYYLGKYKTSDDYRLLKTVCAEERIEKAESAAHEVDECAACGDGGSLLICDGCESEWHMGCTKPALKAVPVGSWLCDMCVDRAFLAARQQILQRTRLVAADQREGGKKRKLNTTDMTIDERQRDQSKVVIALKAFSSNVNDILSRHTSQSEEAAVPTHVKDASCALNKPTNESHSIL